jgi:hypothetical protein
MTDRRKSCIRGLKEASKSMTVDFGDLRLKLSHLNAGKTYMSESHVDHCRAGGAPKEYTVFLEELERHVAHHSYACPASPSVGQI